MAKVDFDCIVVGAGPAGISAALTMAKKGLSVAVLERGEYPGAKNISGGILFSTVLKRLIPDFEKAAPLERHIVSRKYSLISDDSEIGFELKTQKWDTAPYNDSFTILRGKFDKWFAHKAEENGVEIFTSILAKQLIIENCRVVGVKTEPGGDEIRAFCVIDAEGANPILAKQAGLLGEFNTAAVGLGVKQVISLPRNIIEERFNIRNNQGKTIHYFGECVRGYYGGAFLYTNKESLSIGIVMLLSDLVESKLKINELLNEFIANPLVRNYLEGGKVEEYSAHLIPEGGYYALPKRFVKDGFIIVGDAAGLVDASFYYEGSNLAMASGMFAAETVIEAKRKGDFSWQSLSEYEKKLKNSFVIKDLYKFRKMKKMFMEKPWILNKYPEIFADAAADFFKVSETPKTVTEKDAFKRIKREIGLSDIIKTLWSFYKGTR
ncbi:MAG: FAD-dependent oxidoreductase [Planctomycetota bacterium]